MTSSVERRQDEFHFLPSIAFDFRSVSNCLYGWRFLRVNLEYLIYYTVFLFLGFFGLFCFFFYSSIEERIIVMLD